MIYNTYTSVTGLLGQVQVHFGSWWFVCRIHVILKCFPRVYSFVTMRTVICEGRGEVSRFHMIPDVVTDLMEELGADRAIKTLGSRFVLPNVLHQVFRCHWAPTWGTQGKTVKRSVGGKLSFTKHATSGHIMNSMSETQYFCARSICALRERAL